MKFSIITITYNRGHLIGDTIQSVLEQTYGDFEYIIVDDGSTDNTEQIVKNFNDNRIKYFKYNRIGNISKLLNIGIKQSQNEVLALLDSDDLWKNDKLEKIVHLFKNKPDVVFITHNISYFDKIPSQEKPYYNFKKDFHAYSIEMVLKFKILPFPVIVFKKEILPDGLKPFKESFFDSHQDFLFNVASTHKIYFIAESLTFMRIHEGNISKNKKKILPYFYNYYKTVWSLFLKHKINTVLFIDGYLLNTKNLISFLIKAR